jgi:hypothetical protein
MMSLTKTFDIVENTANSDCGLENGTILKHHFELFELVLILFDLAIDVGHKTIFEGSFPW